MYEIIEFQIVFEVIISYKRLIFKKKKKTKTPDMSIYASNHVIKIRYKALMATLKP